MTKPTPEHNDPSFSSIRTFMRLPNRSSLEEVDFAVVGLPFDTGSGLRIGSRFAPEAVRNVSISLGSYNVGIGISIFESLGGIDYGDVKVVPGYIEDSFENIEKVMSDVHQENVIPIGIGGDHSVILPELRAAVKKHGPLGLVLFDSHHDCWKSYQGHLYFNSTTIRRAVEENLIDTEHSIMCGLRGSVYSAKSWGYPIELGFEIVSADEIHKSGVEKTCKKILNRVKKKPVFLSFDMDFIDPAYAPGVGTPEIGGFTSWQAQELIRGIRGINIKAADVVEIIPSYDSSQITAITGANIIFEIMSLLAWYKSIRSR